MASSLSLPDALITCVLPEYEEKHIWWLVLQYLEDANFTHTASAFKLELSCKGIKNEFLGLSKEEVRKHFTCLVTRQLVGPSTAAPVLPRSAAGVAARPGEAQLGVAGQLTSSSSKPAAGVAQQQQQQQQQQKLQLQLSKGHDRDARKQQTNAAAGSAGDSGVCRSPMDIDQRHPQQHDQGEHHRAMLQRQQQQQQQQAAAAKVVPQQAEQQQQQQQLPARQVKQHVLLPPAAAVPAAFVAAAAVPPGTAAASSAAGSATPAAAEPAALPADAVVAPADTAAAVPSASAAVPPMLVARISSYPEGDDVLDFGDGDDEDATAAADMEAEEIEEEHGDSEAAEEEQQQQGGSAEDGAARRNREQLSPTAHQQQQQHSGAKPLLRRGREAVPNPPSRPSSAAHSSRSRSRARSSRGRAHSSSVERSRSPSERHRRSPTHSRGRASRSHSHSRSRSRGRSNSRSRRRSSSYSPRSRSHSRRSSRGRSRSYTPRSHSRGREYSHARSSRSRSRGRGGSRSHSRGKDGGYHSRSGGSGGYHHGSQHPQQQQQYYSRQGGADFRGGRGGYNAPNAALRGRGGRTSFVQRGSGEYDMSSRRTTDHAGVAAGGNAYQPQYQRGRGGRGYDMGRGYEGGRGGRGGYLQRQPGRPLYTSAQYIPGREHADRDRSHEREHNSTDYDHREGERLQHERGSSVRAACEPDRSEGELLMQQLATAGSEPSAVAGGNTAAAAAAGEEAAEPLQRASSVPETCSPNGTPALQSPWANSSRGGGRMGAHPSRGRGSGGRFGGGGHQLHSAHMPIPAPPLGHPPPAAAAGAALDVAGDAVAAAVLLEPGTEVATGKAGGKYDWPPKDGTAAAAAHTRLASAPVRKPDWNGSGAAGAAGSALRRPFVVKGPGVVPARRLSSGIVVSGASDAFDAPEGAPGRGHAAAALGAAAGAGAAVGIDDRWRGSDDEGEGPGGRSGSPGGGSGRWGSGEHADAARDSRDRGSNGGGAVRQQRSSSNGAGPRGEGRDSSPGAVAAELAHAAAQAKAAAGAAAAAAAAGVSGSALLAKRRLSEAAGTVAITDLSMSHDSPMRGGASPASTACGAVGSGPAKRARGSSPA